MCADLKGTIERLNKTMELLHYAKNYIFILRIRIHCVKKMDCFAMRNASERVFRCLLNYGKTNFTSYRKNLTTFVKMAQLRNEPSYIAKITIWVRKWGKTTITWNDLYISTTLTTDMFWLYVQSFQVCTSMSRICSPLGVFWWSAGFFLVVYILLNL